MASEILQHHHGLVQSSDGLHHPGLLTRQHEKAVIQQGRKGVTHCGPVLIGKRVGAQVNIGASESLF